MRKQKRTLGLVTSDLTLVAEIEKAAAEAGQTISSFLKSAVREKLAGDRQDKFNVAVRADLDELKRRLDAGLGLPPEVLQVLMKSIWRLGCVVNRSGLDDLTKDQRLALYIASQVPPLQSDMVTQLLRRLLSHTHLLAVKAGASQDEIGQADVRLASELNAFFNGGQAARGE